MAAALSLAKHGVRVGIQLLAMKTVAAVQKIRVRKSSSLLLLEVSI